MRWCSHRSRAVPCSTDTSPVWERAKVAAGIDHSVRFHDLRHLAGTAAATAGASLREVMARMGHASSDASLRYLKASEERGHEIAQSIGARIPSQAQRQLSNASGPYGDPIAFGYRRRASTRLRTPTDQSRRDRNE